ncbi:glycosyltransferase [Acinetobacter sp. YIM 103518]|uniref:Glycosyltransferase n=1 Tax=Acinetobacter faecalis TaxID=2665161 RepID=A0A6L6GD13_9GAMM|nr:glycosyltransferase family 2 protein [Acinetobacter faecalis]MTD10593.1 glycosyltransferase [Acinetobacter faecalis]
MISIPLLSVIIPTHNRPQYLPRAVKSALEAAPNGDVEVIVVPNGGDETWRESLADLLLDKRIIVSPVEKGHANVARNHGLSLATGRYIRFLDDDDYLYSLIACEQLKDLIDKKSNLSYANLDLVDEQGLIIKSVEPRNKTDYLIDALGGEHSTQPSILIFERNLVKNLRWDTEINKRQDVYWVYSILMQGTFKGVYFSKVVGVWRQHNGERVSRTKKYSQVYKQNAEKILKLKEALLINNLLCSDRSYAVATALWNCLHYGIMYNPIYWYKISLKIKDVNLNACPTTKMYDYKIIRFINPYYIELLLCPYRYLKKLFGYQYEV